MKRSSQPGLNAGYTLMYTRLRNVIIARAASGVVAAKNTTARSRLLCGTVANGPLDFLIASIVLGSMTGQATNYSARQGTSGEGQSEIFNAVPGAHRRRPKV